jgi:peptide/nickel transport system substrate-binding protein
MGAWVSRRDFLVTTGVGVAGLAAGRRAAAQDKKTLVVAWDSDIDSLDPAVFKSQGAYVTVANTTGAPIMWKVRPIEGQPGLFRSVPGEWDGHLAESWAMEDNGATMVF